MKKFVLSLLVGWFAVTGVLRAQTLDQEMSRLAGKISNSLVTQGFKSVAAIDFTDLQGQPTELGRFLSEELAVEIVSTGGVSMVDRANIKSILAEHKLTEAGLVNPENAKKLGEFAGVDVILTGNATALDDGIVMMVKAVATSSSRIVAAGRIKFPKTSEIQQLLSRGISGSSVGSISPSASGKSDTRYQNSNGIATKDIGPLRVVLKSVLPLKLNNGTRGIRCSFEFINLETQRPITVAMNAIAADAYNYMRIGSFLRSTIIDVKGEVWRLRNSDVTGMSIVGVGQQRWDGPMYDASEITTVLSKRDELGSGVEVDPKWRSWDARTYTFMFGSTTEMPPGQRVQVTMTFTQDAGQTAPASQPKVSQMATEIVVGLDKTGSSKLYSLYNLMFDQVSTPVNR
jgi:TolB-like protein